MKLVYPLALVAALAACENAYAADHVVTIEGMAFRPAALELAPGDTVTFVNRDGAPHTATARSGAFDTGRLGRGQSARLRIGSAGTLDYFCAVHPAMTGRLVAK